MDFNGVYVLSTHVSLTGYRSILAVSKTMDECIEYACHHAGRKLNAYRSENFCYMPDCTDGVNYEVELVRSVDWLLGV